jgi:hypothetical protein
LTSVNLRGDYHLASHPKVVSMGIGKVGAAKAIKGGFILSIVLSVGFHAVDQLLNDQKTWHDFVGGVAADVIYVGASFAISSMLVTAFIGGATAMAIGPLIVVVAGGLALAKLFSFLDQYIQLSIVMAGLLREAEAKFAGQLSSVQNEVAKLHHAWSDDAVKLLHRIFAVPQLGFN